MFGGPRPCRYHGSKAGNILGIRRAESEFQKVNEYYELSEEVNCKISYLLYNPSSLNELDISHSGLVD